MITTITNILINTILILGAISFYTLLEHKILGYTQHRNGPNNVLFLGIGQPFSDAINLFTNENSIVTGFNILIYTTSASLILCLALTIWVIVPSPLPPIGLNLSILLFIVISSCSVYPTILIGWSSNSNYSLLGAIRSIAQTISYEISIAIVLIAILIFSTTWNFQNIVEEGGLITTIIIPYLYYMWIVTILAETNRAPFDFAEGESELVSGFNTEYAGSLFVIIFISEYINIIFVSLITSSLINNFIMMGEGEWFLISGLTLILATLILIVRSSYPRLRYDQLINLTWTSFLPLSVATIIFILCII